MSAEQPSYTGSPPSYLLPCGCSTGYACPVHKCQVPWMSNYLHDVKEFCDRMTTMGLPPVAAIIGEERIVK
jgi:hypothetical protein